jgi:acetyl-CoA carboxylase alpha subunit
MAVRKTRENYGNLDYSALMFDVMSLPFETNLIESFPALKAFPEFSKLKPQDRDKLIRFVMLCYDKKTPLIQIKDYDKRRIIAGELAGLSGERIKKIIDEKDKSTNDLIQCWLTEIQNHRKFKMLVATEKTFQMVLNSVNEVMDDDMDADDIIKAQKLKAENIKQARILEKDITELEREIYPEYDQVRGVLKDKIESEWKGGPAEELHKVYSKSKREKLYAPKA